MDPANLLSSLPFKLVTMVLKALPVSRLWLGPRLPSMAPRPRRLGGSECNSFQVAMTSPSLSTLSRGTATSNSLATAAPRSSKVSLSRPWQLLPTAM